MESLAWHRKLFWGAITLSLVGHVVFLSAQLLLAWWGVWGPMGSPAKLIYDREPIHSTSEWTQEEAARPQARMRELVRSITVTIPSAGGGRVASGGEVVLGMPKPELYAGFGETLSEGWSGAGGDSALWATAVDLTDLAVAAQGNPVLLSYFGAIREQIQRTANEAVWAPTQGLSAGLVYVGFIIGKNGRLQSAAVMPERSTASPQLCAIALQLVQASSPFPPFPPSFQDPSKAVVVPIEFGVGSS